MENFLYIRQRRTNQTPFRYEISGDLMLYKFYIDLLPKGVRIKSSNPSVELAAKVSYQQFNDWLKRLKQSISGDLGDAVITDILDEANTPIIRFHFGGEYRPINSLEVAGRPFVTGRMTELKSLIEVFEIAGMVSMFMDAFVSPYQEKLDFYEDRYGTIADLSCPRCNNPYTLDSDDECMYCRECPTCTAAVYDHTCQECGHYLGDDND